MKPFLIRALACELMLIVLPMLAAQAQSAQPDLTALKIEDLMNVDVTSAAKKEQKLSQVPAAIFVIATEDIRRSGPTNIPDLLRMAPGLQVDQIDPSTWAMSARGFKGEYSDKLLVLIDGRIVYTPPSEKISLGLVGQNLLKDVHEEYAGPDLTVLPGLIRRNAYAKAAWRF
jgi:outer membrane receptor for ferrienterochelin and colicin